MTERTFSATRTKATWKPRVTDDDLPFFSSSGGTSIFLGLADTELARFEGGGRAPQAVLPYTALSKHRTYDENVGPIRMHDTDEMPKDIHLDYRIIGGLNNNALEVSWKIDNGSEYSLSWIAVKTFTGMQLKYILPKKRSPLLFAFADEDAYAYCNEDPCRECIFMCKRGFVVYAAILGWGIVRMPLERATATGGPAPTAPRE